MKKTLLLLSTLLGGFTLWFKQRSKSNPVEFRDKIVLITGASAGIGKATAQAFAAEGANLIIAARRTDALNTLKAELENQYAISVLVVPTDISSDEDLQHLVESALDAFGRIDILVNNAGLAMGGAFLDHDPAYMRKMIDVNLYGAIRLTQLVLPTMVEQKSGHIVNITSIAGKLHAPGQAVYTATKTGLVAHSKALRRELFGTGIHVSMVHPGWTQTEILERTTDRAKRRQAINPLMPLFTPAEMAKVILEAVRYRQKEVIHAGVGFRAGAFGEWLSPGMIDIQMGLLSRWMINTMKELGSEDGASRKPPNG